MPAVLLDRDGVINHNRNDYVTRWEEFKFLPGALGALARLRHYAVAVVTNQSAVGRGLLTPAGLERIHRRMLAHCARNGAIIDSVFACLHAPWEGCGCRKPQPQLLLQAMRALRERPEHCVAVGDGHEDLLAARAAGVPFALVLTGRGQQTLRHQACHTHPPLLIARDLWEASQAIQAHFDCLTDSRAA